MTVSDFIDYVEGLCKLIEVHTKMLEKENAELIKKTEKLYSTKEN